MSNPYAPDEPASTIYSEKTWLEGALLSNIFYGIELTLFAICFTLLVRKMNRSNYKRQLGLLTFVTLIFALGTIFMGCLSQFTLMSFIDDRNYPGGPAAFEEAPTPLPVDVAANVAFAIGNWLMDLLLVWRCTVIYAGTSGPLLWAVMIIPCLLFLASFILGILFLAQTNAASPFISVNITLAYFITTLVLNVLVTLLIVGRLLVYRREVTRLLGSEHVVHYANIAAILVESASLYSVFSILFLVPFALNNPLSQVFLQTIGQVQTVSSLLIIFRVATGKGWTEGTSTLSQPGANEHRLRNLSSMKFASAPSQSTVLESKTGVTVSQVLSGDKDVVGIQGV